MHRNNRSVRQENLRVPSSPALSFLPGSASGKERSQHLLLLLQVLDAALQKDYLDSFFRILPVDVGLQDAELILENLYLCCDFIQLLL